MNIMKFEQFGKKLPHNVQKNSPEIFYLTKITFNKKKFFFYR